MARERLKAAAMDLCLHLVRRDHGSAIANIAAEEFGHVEILATMVAQLLEKAPLGITADAVQDAFLAGVEQRALRMARVATRDRDEALDLVQDAMFRWVRRYAGHPAEQWAPLFYRCVQNRVRDWQRRQWRCW